MVLNSLEDLRGFKSISHSDITTTGGANVYGSDDISDDWSQFNMFLQVNLWNKLGSHIYVYCLAMLGYSASARFSIADETDNYRTKFFDIQSGNFPLAPMLEYYNGNELTTTSHDGDLNTEENCALINNGIPFWYGGTNCNYEISPFGDCSNTTSPACGPMGYTSEPYSPVGISRASFFLYYEPGELEVDHMIENTSFDEEGVGTYEGREIYIADGTKNKPAYSCSSLARDFPLFTSGLYWIKPLENSDAFKTYCKIDNALQKGWTLAAFSSTDEQGCVHISADILDINPYAFGDTGLQVIPSDLEEDFEAILNLAFWNAIGTVARFEYKDDAEWLDTKSVEKEFVLIHHDDEMYADGLFHIHFKDEATSHPFSKATACNDSTWFHKDNLCNKSLFGFCGAGSDEYVKHETSDENFQRGALWLYHDESHINMVPSNYYYTSLESKSDNLGSLPLDDGIGKDVFDIMVNTKYEDADLGTIVEKSYSNILKNDGISAPAQSCTHIKLIYPHSPSGKYKLLVPQNKEIEVYCDMHGSVNGQTNILFFAKDAAGGDGIPKANLGSDKDWSDAPVLVHETGSEYVNFYMVPLYWGTLGQILMIYHFTSEDILGGMDHYDGFHVYGSDLRLDFSEHVAGDATGLTHARNNPFIESSKHINPTINDYRCDWFFEEPDELASNEGMPWEVTYNSILSYEKVGWYLIHEGASNRIVSLRNELLLSGYLMNLYTLPPIGTSANPGTSCSQMRYLHPEYDSGVYWIEIDVWKFEVYCR
eukprot:TRINITY_DN6843_c0_g4_i2.p1 TRINITY_DN6843_c0_g4~~TRINITY_DN6843_c0_g4_i2.p1  ORF type:complete len:776 (-),score=150.69 TRINITY_DN6843_c0_g4_i2:43-2343(-)